MKKAFAFLAAPLLATAVLAQVPPPPGAMGRNWQQGPGGWDRGAFWQGAPANPGQRIQFLQDRINRGVADGSLNRREANRATRELANVRQWIRRMRWNGDRLTPDQRNQVQARLDRISSQIRWARRNGR